MKRLLIVGGVVAGAAIAAKGIASRGGGHGPNFERMIERMPEGAPPRWVYENVTAIRQNTERILKLLEKERAPAAAS
jgi:hypothetical protein